MKKKQQELLKKVAIIVGVGIIAYFVLRTVRDRVTDRAASTYSKSIAKDTVQKVKNFRKR